MEGGVCAASPLGDAAEGDAEGVGAKTPRTELREQGTE